MDPVISMRGIVKAFPGVVANDGIDLDFYPGEVHALLGENGAGKTTAMNVLYGLYLPDAGEIYFKGRRVNIDSTQAAIRLGIGMVHQHFMLVEPFTVAENIVLGNEPVHSGFLDIRKAVKDVEALSERYGLKVDPYAKITGISVGTQQRVEILKALYRGAEILILDEPTAVLTPQEVHELRQITDNLIAEGKTIIFITHKLKEVMEMSQRVTVIRRGKVIETLPTEKGTPRSLARMMVGRDVVLQLEKADSNPSAPMLEVKDLAATNDRGLPAVRGVSFTVRAGEIYGIAGVDGNGQTELVEALTGLRRSTRGKVLVKGVDITNRGVRRVNEAGVAHIPEDRQKRGLVLDFSIAENIVLENYYRQPFARRLSINYVAVFGYARRLIQKFDVRTPGEKVMARTLSGGNQQKVVVAREIERNPDVMIAAQPTRGLDVGAIEFVHKQLIEERDRGRAVVLVSLELDEVMSVSDRIAVMYEGRIVAEMNAQDATEEKLGLLMAGVVPQDREGGEAV